MDSKFFRKYVDINNEAMVPEQQAPDQERLTTMTFPFVSASDIIKKLMNRRQSKFETADWDSFEWDDLPVTVYCNLRGTQGSTSLHSEDYYEDYGIDNAMAVIKDAVRKSAVKPKQVTLKYEVDGNGSAEVIVDLLH